MKQQYSVVPRFVLVATLGLAGYASAQTAVPDTAAPAPAAQPADALPGHFAEEHHTATYEITAIDAPTRMVTLKEEGQEPQTYTLGKDVRNVDQLKVGDRVKVDTYQSTSIQVLPPGDLVNEAVAAADRSQPGEKPGGVAVRKQTSTATVSSIFPDSKEFLTRDAKDQLRTWKVKDAKDLEALKSGDRVQFTSISTLAVNVTPAPPKATTNAAPATGSAKTEAAPAPAPAKP